jgi:hypothetical protein
MLSYLGCYADLYNIPPHLLEILISTYIMYYKLKQSISVEIVFFICADASA